MKLLTMALALMVVALPAMAWSELRRGEQRAEFAAGVGVPSYKSQVSGVDIDMGELGGDFHFAYLYHITPGFSTGGNLGIFASREKTMKDFPRAKVDTLSSLSVTYVEALGRYSFIAQGRYHPYLIAGLGYCRVHENVDWVPGIGQAQRNLYSKDATGLAASLGGGLEYEMANSWVLGIDLRWRYTGATASFQTLTSEPGQIKAGSMLSAGLSVGYRFGK